MNFDKRLALTALLISCSSTAFAQVDQQAAPGNAAADVQEPDGESDAQADDFSASEIIVTAQKRSSTLEKVPASIIVVSGGDLEQRGISGAASLTAAVPNLSYGTVLGNPTVTIRGVGLPVVTGDSQQGVASYIDGVYLTIPSLADLALGDLERVEVLRGPQGTLYGRNATGGAISYITRLPSSTFGASATVGYANHDTYTAKGYITGPIVGDVLTGRLFGSLRRTDGYIKNLATGDNLGALNTDAVRAVLRFKPSADFTADLTGFYQHDYGTFATFETFGLFGNPAGRIFDATGKFSTKQGVVNEDFDEPSFRTTYGATATLTGDIGDITVKSITGYIDHKRRTPIDGDGANLPIITFLPPPNNQLITISDRAETDRTISQEVNVSGDVGSVNFVAGAYYARETNDSVIPISFLATGPSITFPFVSLTFQRRSVIETVAGFADLTLSLSDRFRLFGGGRFSHDTNKGSLSNPIPAADGTSCAMPTDFSKSEDHFTPKFGAQLDVASRQNVYVQYQQGYKSGGNSIVSCNNFYKPEKLTSYEVGYKAVFSGGMTFNITGFYYDYRNYQVFQITPSLAADIVNAPRARTFGLEADFAARLTPNLRFETGFGYLNAEYSRDFFDTDFYANGPAATPENLNGRSLVQAPKFSGNAALELSLPVQSSLFENIRLRAEMNYSSSFFLRRFALPFDRQKAYAIGSLFATFTSPDDSWQLRAYLTNITDRRYRVGEIDNGQTGLLNGGYSAPRTYGAEVTVKF